MSVCIFLCTPIPGSSSLELLASAQGMAGSQWVLGQCKGLRWACGGRGPGDITHASVAAGAGRSWRHPREKRQPPFSQSESTLVSGAAANLNVNHSIMNDRHTLIYSWQAGSRKICCQCIMVRRTDLCCDSRLS